MAEEARSSLLQKKKATPKTLILENMREELDAQGQDDLWPVVVEYFIARKAGLDAHKAVSKARAISVASGTAPATAALLHPRPTKPSLSEITAYNKPILEAAANLAKHVADGDASYGTLLKERALVLTKGMEQASLNARTGVTAQQKYDSEDLTAAKWAVDGNLKSINGYVGAVNTDIKRVDDLTGPEKMDALLSIVGQYGVQASGTIGKPAVDVPRELLKHVASKVELGQVSEFYDSKEGDEQWNNLLVTQAEQAAYERREASIRALGPDATPEELAAIAQVETFTVGRLREIFDESVQILNQDLPDVSPESMQPYAEQQVAHFKDSLGRLPVATGRGADRDPAWTEERMARIRARVIKASTPGEVQKLYDDALRKAGGNAHAAFADLSAPTEAYVRAATNGAESTLSGLLDSLFGAIDDPSRQAAASNLAQNLTTIVGSLITEKKTTLEEKAAAFREKVVPVLQRNGYNDAEINAVVDDWSKVFWKGVSEKKRVPEERKRRKEWKKTGKLGLTAGLEEEKKPDSASLAGDTTLTRPSLAEGMGVAPWKERTLSAARTALQLPATPPAAAPPAAPPTPPTPQMLDTSDMFGQGRGAVDVAVPGAGIEAAQEAAIAAQEAPPPPPAVETPVAPEETPVAPADIAGDAAAIVEGQKPRWWQSGGTNLKSNYGELTGAAFENPYVKLQESVKLETPSIAEGMGAATAAATEGEKLRQQHDATIDQARINSVLRAIEYSDKQKDRDKSLERADAVGLGL